MAAGVRGPPVAAGLALVMVARPVAPALTTSTACPGLQEGLGTPRPSVRTTRASCAGSRGSGANAASSTTGIGSVAVATRHPRTQPNRQRLPGGIQGGEKRGEPVAALFGRRAPRCPWAVTHRRRCRGRRTAGAGPPPTRDGARQPERPRCGGAPPGSAPQCGRRGDLPKPVGSMPPYHDITQRGTRRRWPWPEGSAPDRGAAVCAGPTPRATPRVNGAVGHVSQHPGPHRGRIGSRGNAVGRFPAAVPSLMRKGCVFNPVIPPPEAFAALGAHTREVVAERTR